MAASGETSPAVVNSSNSMLSNICFRYIPLAGGASFIGFASHVAAPTLFKRALGSNDFVLSNALWFNAHLGTGLYLYDRSHLKKASKYERVVYAVFGAAMFNFGSVLFLATTKQQFPKCDHLRIMYCAAAACGLLYMGRRYLKFIDENTA